MPEPILTARDGAIVTVTLNNPEKLNALSKAMWSRLGETMRALDADESVRCIVLRGAGGKAFAAGADMPTSPRFTPSVRTPRRQRSTAIRASAGCTRSPSVVIRRWR